MNTKIKISIPTCFYRGIRKNGESEPKIYYPSGESASKSISDAKFIEMSYVEVKNNLDIGEYIEYSKIKEIFKNDKNIMRRILLSVDWNFKGQWIPISQNNLDDGIYYDIYARSSDLSSQPEFINALNESKYDSFSYKVNNENVFIFSDKVKLFPFFENEEVEINKGIMILANNFLMKYKEENQNLPEFKYLIKGFFLSNDLSDFLSKNGVKNSILIVKGESGNKKDKKVKSVISTGGIIIDPESILNKGDARFFGKKEYLSKWKAIEREQTSTPNEETQSASY